METKDEILKEIQNLKVELVQTEKELKLCKDDKLRKILNEEKKQIELDLEDALASLETIDKTDQNNEEAQMPNEVDEPRMETYEIDRNLETESGL
jgi:ubiquitin